MMFGGQYKLYIELVSGETFDLNMPCPLKQLPTQEESINKLIKKYGK